MNIYFVILLIIIIVVVNIITFSNNINEYFCTKNSSNKCLSNFTQSYQVIGGQAIGINNNSITPSKNPKNPNEKIMNFKCIPNNFPNEIGGSDCNIWPNIDTLNNTRTNTAKDWFPDSNYYINCNQIGKSKPGCAAGYDTMGYKSYADLGYSCNIGNGLIPTKIDDATGIITCATDSTGNCLVRSSKTECTNYLNLIPIDNFNKNINNGLICSEGKVGEKCTNMYNTLELKTLNELGYSCNNSIGDGKLPGKVTNDSNYNFASYDNKTIVDNCNLAINFQPLNEIKDVVCSEYTTQTDLKYPTACEQAYTKFNLYPSTNPLVIKGNDPNYNIGNTFTDLFSMYLKYQQALPPGTNSNSSQSISDGIQNVLSKTPLKIACCNRNNPTDNSEKNISIRVPVNPLIESINPNTKQFNFQYSQINIPEGSCPTNLYNGSTDCNNFYGLYCDNIMNYMQKQNIDVQTELLNYAPECACYAPQTQSQLGYPPSTPSVCYKNGCDTTSNPNVYLDPNSRDGNTQKTCSLTICNSINDFSGLTVGGGANISTQTQNQCGSNGSNNANNTNTTNTTNTNETSTNTTNTNTTNTNETSTNTINEPSTNTTTESITNKISTTTTLGLILFIIIILLFSSSSAYFIIKKK